MESADRSTPADPLAQDEARINRVVWGSRALSLFLTAVVVAFFVIVEADAPWQYLGYPLLAALPFAYGIVSARYIRLMHVDLLRRYQAQVMLRTMELEKMASKDDMTQLFNRRHFYERFQQELASVHLARQPLALILLDIDGLKRINDEYGHAVGDIMIANLGKAISKHTRATDVPARLGGDEFAILMPDTDKRGAFALAERLWQELEETPAYEHEGLEVPMNVSIGVSGYPWGGENIDEMMHWADSDMYANKVSRRLPQAPVPVKDKPLPDDAGPDNLDWV